VEAHLGSAEGMACVARVFTFSRRPECLAANGTNHAFAFPAKAGPHFIDPGGMEG